MTIAFILTMPGVGSWNGRWSGEGTLYAITQKVSLSQAAKLNGRHFGYSWTDGWRASIECRCVEGQELRKLRKASKGFCGYEWMVKSILERGCIKADHEIEEVTP